MKHRVRNFCAAAAGLGAVAILAAQAPPEPQQPPTPSAEIGIRTTIRGEPGAPPHYAVPDFIALSNDKETVEAAKLMAQVLWDDLSFEREFDMIPRDTYRTIETIPAADTIAYDRWREYDPEDTVRFYALRLHEAGMIKSTPQKIIEKGTDWRFFNELKKELKG